MTSEEVLEAKDEISPGEEDDSDDLRPLIRSLSEEVIRRLYGTDGVWEKLKEDG